MGTSAEAGIDSGDFTAFSGEVGNGEDEGEGRFVASRATWGKYWEECRPMQQEQESSVFETLAMITCWREMIYIDGFESRHE
jgi:hypothetical protein